MDHTMNTPMHGPEADEYGEVDHVALTEAIDRGRWPARTTHDEGGDR